MSLRDGDVVTVEYTVRTDDGGLVDSTGGCGPMEVMWGSGQLFPALEDRMGDMQEGETREVRIPAADAFGVWRDELVREMPRDRFDPALTLEPGESYTLKVEGKTLRFRVVAIEGDTVKADFNSPRAGRDLLCTVTVVGVRAATPEEARRGRV